MKRLLIITGVVAVLAIPTMQAAGLNGKGNNGKGNPSPPGLITSQQKKLEAKANKKAKSVDSEGGRIRPGVPEPGALGAVLAAGLIGLGLRQYSRRREA